MKQPTKPLKVRWDGPALRQLTHLLRTFSPPVSGPAGGGESDPRPATGDITPLPDPVPATEPIGILDPHED
ncbi:MAG: hypothetical protein M3Z04_14095 [Chloroflexota bacterium]|nr:hypothetical protein [Chloroflexota bacterium]